MPDPILILKAMAAAAGLAAVVLLLVGWRWPARLSAGSALAAGLGFGVGCRLLGAAPNWPPRVDQDRWLLVLMPAVLGIEFVAGFLGRWRWLVWLPRASVAAGAGGVLLHNTVYLADLTGPGSREWTPTQANLILSGLAAALAASWAGLLLQARRPAATAIPLAQSVACAGAAVTVMLSGYASGGQLGFPLAAALAGAALASLVFRGRPDVAGAVSLGVVGLFALVVIGRFFGVLTTTNALLLFFAPTLGWLTELPWIGRLRPGLRGGIRLIFTAVPVALALFLAQQKFVADSQSVPSASPQPSIDDYLNFGK